MKKKHTQRGFPYYQFKDKYNETCSLQLSSLADDRCIWLGIDKPKPQRLGPHGWEDFGIPDDVSVPSRMHLSAKQVKKLLPILHKFVETGDL